MSPIEYLVRMPAAVPSGKVLVHNRGQPTSRLGSRDFKAWFDDPSDRYELCTCGWAPQLSEHYQIRHRGSGVPVDRTKGEIEAMLTDYGASHFTYNIGPNGEIVFFEVQGRRLRFNVPLEEGEGPTAVRSRNQRWREFLMCVRAKLDSATTGIESIMEAFLAHVVMPDNRTVYEHVAPHIAQAVEAREMPSPPVESGTK